MEIEKLEAPEERKARWMNDNDLNKPLVLEELNKLSEGYELIFSTPLLERVRRTTDKDKPEYAFIYNSLRSGNKVFKYVKKNGFRTPELA